MGIMLFRRTSRSMSLTESGYAALERASHILKDGEEIEAEITEQSNSLRGLIRVSAPMSFGLHHLAPILPGFLAAHPEVELDVQFDDQQVDLVAERFDLALRIANLVDSCLLARRLCTVRILLVGSPAYFKHHGKPQHPRDLVRHKAFQYSYTRSGKSWRFRHKLHGEFMQTMPIQMQANNAEALTPALLAGLGLALQPEFLVWDELQSGKLETAMDEWEVEPVALHIVTPPGRRRPARIKAFMDYVLQRFSREPWAHPMDESHLYLLPGAGCSKYSMNGNGAVPLGQ